MTDATEIPPKEQNWLSKIFTTLKDLFWDEDPSSDGSPPEDHYPLF